MRIFQITKTLFAETFLSLKCNNYRNFLAGQSMSLIGTWMQRTAQQWLVYTLTDSAFLLGLLGVCQFAPMLLFSLLVGVYVDRYSKKNILVLTQLIQMLQALVLAALVWFGIVQYWHVFILAAIFGLTNTFDMPTRHSFIFELVGKDSIRNAVGLNAIVVNIARIIGPGLAGIIMARYGIAFCFFLNGISYLAVILSLSKVKSSTVTIRKNKQNIREEILEGLHYIRNQKKILYPILAMLVIGTIAFNTDVIIPVFARVILDQGAQGYSFILSAIGLGALIGSVLFSVRSQNSTLRNGILISALSLSVCLLLAGSCESYMLVVLIMAFFGAFNMTFITTVQSTIQLNSNDEYRGRVMSVYAMVFTGTTPIGNLVTGVVTENYGPSNGLYFCGLLSILLMVAIHKNFSTNKLSKVTEY